MKICQLLRTNLITTKYVTVAYLAEYRVEQSYLHRHYMIYMILSIFSAVALTEKWRNYIVYLEILERHMTGLLPKTIVKT